MNGINKNLNFNPAIERKSLKAKGFLSEHGDLTSKCNILEDKDPLDPFYHKDRETEEKALTHQAARLSQLFPLLLPNGRYGRSASMKLVKDRLKAFLRLYTYDWDIIFEATASYVDRCRAGNFAYMKPVHNFILKDDEESTLALECEIVENGKKHQSFSRTI